MFLFHLSSTQLLTDFTIRLSRRVFFKRQKLLTRREHMCSSPVLLVESVLLIFIVFCVVLCFVCLPPVSSVSHVVSDWMFHSVLCIVCLPPVSCVSHIVSHSGCSIPCYVLFGFLLCRLCPMFSVTGCSIPCCVLFGFLLRLVCPMLSVTGCFIPCCVLFAFLLCLVCPILSVTLDVPFRVVYCLASSCVLCVPCCQ